MANLTNANLGGTNLVGTDFRGTNFGGANLIGADLRGSNLRRSILTGADLLGADLLGADLRGADLLDTDFADARLPEGCNFYSDLPQHWITIIHDVAHIGCHVMSLSGWLSRGQEIGEDYGYTDEEIDLYMEILRRAHESRRTK
jgi:hypothetical protein